MKDGLARLRDRVAGRDDPTGSRYVLVPGGTGRRRRMAEVGAVAGIAVVVLAFVGATAVLRPSSAPTPAPSAPGLPVPTEMSGAPTALPPASSESSPVPVPAATGLPTAVGRRPVTPTATSEPPPATTPAPATTRAPAPGSTPTATPTPPVTSSPAPSASPSVSPSSPTSPPTTSPAVPVPQP